MADGSQDETFCSPESTEVVVKTLSMELEPSSNATEAETHVTLNGYETQLLTEKVTESAPQQVQQVLTADDEPTVEGVALQGDYQDEPQKSQGVVEGKYEEDKRYSLLQPDDVGIEGKASEGQVVCHEQESEGANEDIEREEDGQKRYSVLTNDDVGVHGIGLQSQLQVEKEEAYVVQQMEETENMQQVDETIATRPISILSSEEPNVEGVAIESELAEDEQESGSQIGEELCQKPNEKVNEAEEKRYSVLTDDDVDIHGVGLQSQMLETNEEVTSVPYNKEEENQGVNGTKRINILTLEDPNVEGVAIESEERKTEEKLESQQTGEELCQEPNRSEAEEKRYSVLTDDDVDIHGVGLHNQVLETKEEVTTSLDEKAQEKQGEDEDSTKRISIVSLEDSNVGCVLAEGVLVEGEIQEDEGTAELAQIDEPNETSEVLHNGLDETQLDSVVMEGNFPGKQMSSEAPFDTNETASTVEPKVEGIDVEELETKIQLASVEFTKNTIETPQEDQNETEAKTNEETLQVKQESESPKEISLSDETPPQKRTKEVDQDEDDEQKPFEESMQTDERNLPQLDEFLANVTEIEFQESTTEQISSPMDAVEDKLDIDVVKNQESIVSNGYKSTESHESVDEFVNVQKMPAHRLSQYIRKLEASDWKSGENLSSGNYGAAEDVDNSSSSLEHAYNLEMTPKENIDKPPDDSVHHSVDEFVNVQKIPEHRLSQYIRKLEASDWKSGENLSSDNVRTAEDVENSSTSLENAYNLEMTLKENTDTPQEDVAPESVDEFVNVQKMPEHRLSQYIRKLEASDWKSGENLSSDNFRTAEDVENSSSSLEQAYNLEMTLKEKTDKPPEDFVEEHFEPARKPEQRLSQYIHKLESEERMSSNQSWNASESTAKTNLGTEEVSLNKKLPENASPEDEDKGINEELLETSTYSEQQASKDLLAPKSEPPTDKTKEGYTQEPAMTLVTTSVLEFSQEDSQSKTKDQDDIVIADNKDQKHVEQILAVIDTLPEDEQLTGSESATKEIGLDNKHMVAPANREDNVKYFEDQTPPTKRQSLEETAAFKKEPDEVLFESFTASKVAFEEISQGEEASKPFHDFGKESVNGSPDKKADFGSNMKDDAVVESSDTEHQAEHKVEEIVSFFEDKIHESQENQENFSFHKNEKAKETDASKENQEIMKAIENNTVSSGASIVHTTNDLKQEDETPQKEETFPILMKQTQDVEQSERESVEITVASEEMLEESAFTPVSTGIAPVKQDEIQESDDQNTNQSTVISTEDQLESTEPELTDACYVKSRQLSLEESSKEGSTLQTKNETNKSSEIMSGADDNKQETLPSNTLNDLSWPVIFDEEENTLQADQLLQQSETDKDLILSSELKNNKDELDIDKPDKVTGTSPPSQDELQSEAPKKHKTQGETDINTDDKPIISETTLATMKPSTTVETASTTGTSSPSQQESQSEAPKKQKAQEESGINMDDTPITSKTTMEETKLATMKPSKTVETTTTKVAKKTIVLQESNEHAIGKSKINAVSPEIRVTSATPTPSELDQIKEEEHPGVAPLASREEDSVGDETKLIGDESKKAKDKEPEIKTQETSPQSAARKPNAAGGSDDGEPLVAKKSHTKKCCTIF